MKKNNNVFANFKNILLTIEHKDHLLKLMFYLIIVEVVDFSFLYSTVRLQFPSDHRTVFSF